MSGLAEVRHLRLLGVIIIIKPLSNGLLAWLVLLGQELVILYDILVEDIVLVLLLARMAPHTPLAPGAFQLTVVASARLYWTFVAHLGLVVQLVVVFLFHCVLNISYA